LLNVDAGKEAAGAANEKEGGQGRLREIQHR
jgi:hypothetical protein